MHGKGEGARIPLLSAALMRGGVIDPAAMSGRAAREAWNAYRAAAGMRGGATFTMAGASNSKLAKSTTHTVSLTLAPSTAAGDVNACAAATKECIYACVLMTAGRGTFPNVRAARILRTRFAAEHPQAAVSLIAAELCSAVRIHGDIVARLNVASDIPWEHVSPGLFDIDGVRFYDYTKLHPSARGARENYRITYSVSGAAHSERTALDYMAAGGTAAVVFDRIKGEELPATWHGYTVIDGDASDDRTRDPRGVVVGLRVKGAGRTLTVGGFIKSATATP